MDYEIPIKIKDESGVICNCVIRTEYNDRYCYFLSNISTFNGRHPDKAKTHIGFIYSWRLRDYRNNRDWEYVFKGKQEKIKEQLKKSKTLYDFFNFFVFEWPEKAYCLFNIIQEKNTFEEIEL